MHTFIFKAVFTTRTFVHVVQCGFARLKCMLPLKVGHRGQLAISRDLRPNKFGLFALKRSD
jgi:hypothetical protein